MPHRSAEVAQALRPVLPATAAEALDDEMQKALRAFIKDARDKRRGASLRSVG